MSAADLMLDSAIISALGWTLVHFLWQGCLIALIYWFVCALAPRHAAGLRYWIGLAGMLLSLLALVATFSLLYAPDARFGPQAVSAMAVNPFLVLSGHLPDGLALLESGIEPVLHWVVMIWMIGVFWISLLVARDGFEVRGLLHHGVVATEAQLQISLENYKAKLGVQMAVRLVASTRVLVPMAVGCLRPVILLPVSVLSRLPQDQLEMILAHELGHIRRFDYLFNLLQVLVETLLFYHPAIGWMSRRVREEREHCCDDLVVRVCGRPATYARALTNLEVMRSTKLRAAVQATGGNLLTRIRLIVDGDQPGRKSNVAQFALAGIAGLLLAFGTQQGYSLSTELNRVAFSAQLQASDVQWKTWGRSRAAWGEGVSGYAKSMRKKQLAVLKQAVLKIESMSWKHLVEPDFDFEEYANRDKPEHEGLVFESFHTSVVPQIDPPDSGAAALQAQAPHMHAPQGIAFRENSTLPELIKVSAVLSALPSESPQIRTREMASSGKYAINPSRVTVKPLKSRVPNYPWRARKEGIEGFVELEFSVDADGRVADVEVLDAMPAGVFEEAASKAISRWTFAASEVAGSRYRQVFDFELQEEAKMSPRHRSCFSTGSRTCSQLSTGVFVVWVNDTTKDAEHIGIN